MANAEILDAFTELVHFTEVEGVVTPRLWHERVKPNLTRKASDRHWTRTLERLQAFGVPHDRVPVDGCLGVRMRVTKADLEARYSKPLKRCGRCPALHPPRAPWFYADAREDDGLDRYCAACRRAMAAESVERKLASSDASRRYRLTPAGRLADRKYEESRRSSAERRAAVALFRAIERGEVVRPDRCPTCGRGARVQAHWRNPSRPLDVKWACRRCRARVTEYLPANNGAGSGATSDGADGSDRQNSQEGSHA